MKRLFLIGFVSVFFILTGCNFVNQVDIPQISGKVIALSSLKYDWGDIDINGGDVLRRFRLKNDSDQPLYLTGAQTSCMCTQVRYVSVDGKESPMFGMHNTLTDWSMEIAAGDEFEVEVVFDPMAHGPSATGPIRRNIQLFTTSARSDVAYTTRVDQKINAVELVVEGNVLSSDEFKLQQDLFKYVFGDFAFIEKEHDFGVIKQSGGIQEYQFPFEYRGSQMISVTAVIGSCACTTGEISQSQLSPGERGFITLKFDPNLHEEPNGQFFKTITIKTDPPLDNLPELKMWAEIDLDLGPEAYKLKGSHND